MTSNKSDFNNGTTTCVSGSPNLQLYSRTLGPDFVTITPAYNKPTYGEPNQFYFDLIKSFF